MNRRHSTTVLQASQESPIFIKLYELASESVARLEAVRKLIPDHLQSSIHAGPIEGTSWCLILDNNSISGKIKQLLPAMEAHLRSRGYTVDTIRIKVLAQRKN